MEQATTGNNSHTPKLGREQTRIATLITTFRRSLARKRKLFGWRVLYLQSRRHDGQEGVEIKEPPALDIPVMHEFLQLDLVFWVTQ